MRWALTSHAGASGLKGDHGGPGAERLRCPDRRCSSGHLASPGAASDQLLSRRSTTTGRQEGDAPLARRGQGHSRADGENRVEDSDDVSHRSGRRQRGDADDARRDGARLHRLGELGSAKSQPTTGGHGRSATCSRTVGPLGAYDLPVSARPGRSAAHRPYRSGGCAQVTLSVKDPTRGGEVVEMGLAAVRAQEIGTTPLMVRSPSTGCCSRACPLGPEEEEARAIVTAYTFRWRIEEFHRRPGSRAVATSKRANCARSRHCRKWALVLATVAVRASSG